MKKLTSKRKLGQAMTEYIIIVAVVAIAAIAIAAVFGDQIRALFGGAATELGADSGDVSTALQEKSADKLKSLGDSVSQ